MDGMDGMVIIGHRSSKSTFGANKMEKFCNSHFQGLHNISLAEASCTERVSEVLFDQQLDPVENNESIQNYDNRSSWRW